MVQIKKDLSVPVLAVLSEMPSGHVHKIKRKKNKTKPFMAFLSFLIRKPSNGGSISAASGGLAGSREFTNKVVFIRVFCTTNLQMPDNGTHGFY
ncbi:hypothetical protein GCM10023091_03480 [Ravibacter arvi]|uniref:Uncharacterized protein n=1 Tax=Ravibacter arvi TaxID=2051041 RepID=A0ABP8LLG3_9BACT